MSITETPAGPLGRLNADLTEQLRLLKGGHTDLGQVGAHVFEVAITQAQATIAVAAQLTRIGDALQQIAAALTPPRPAPPVVIPGRDDPAVRALIGDAE